MTKDDKLFVSDDIRIQFEFKKGEEPNFVTDDENEDYDVTQVEEEDKGKVMRVLKQLDSSYNPLASKYLTQLRDSKPLPDDVSNYVDKILAKYVLTASEDTSGTKSAYTVPKNFKEAWNHPDPVQ